MIPEEGILLLVNKPLEWTSFDVVKKIRNLLRVKKVGHAGTLDPLASGLLLIGVGKMTKKLHELQGLDKSYEGIIEIGRTTPSFDLETDFDSKSDISHITGEQLEKVRMDFLGKQLQFPPAHSAVKVEGVRAYKKARKKEEVVLKGREIVIYEFNIEEVKLPEIYFTVNCSKGTYIRSLAHDFGKKLGVGGYLKSLKRTRIGRYRVEDALSIEEIKNQYTIGDH